MKVSLMSIIPNNSYVSNRDFPYLTTICPNLKELSILDNLTLLSSGRYLFIREKRGTYTNQLINPFKQLLYRLINILNQTHKTLLIKQTQTIKEVNKDNCINLPIISIIENVNSTRLK